MENKYRIIDSSDCWLRPEKHISDVPPSSSIEDSGFNLLHFNTKNRAYQDNPSSKKFVEEVLRAHHAVEVYSDTEAIQLAVQKAKEYNTGANGLFLEFGFCTGRSLNFIAALAYDHIVYGFDSGEGLPEDWRPGFKAGTFAFKVEDQMPFCPLDNTKLVMGKIGHTLPIFIAEHLTAEKNSISFIHIDTDIYSTADTIYRCLEDYILPEKTVIILDEGYNYWETEDQYVDNGWQSHEFKATNEFALRKGYEIEYLGYNATHQQLVLRFKKSPY